MQTMVSFTEGNFLHAISFLGVNWAFKKNETIIQHHLYWSCWIWAISPNACNYNSILQFNPFVKPKQKFQRTKDICPAFILVHETRNFPIHIFLGMFGLQLPGFYWPCWWGWGGFLKVAPTNLGRQQIGEGCNLGSFQYMHLTKTWLLLPFFIRFKTSVTSAGEKQKCF